MPWRVLVEWQQYDEVEPFGELRADLRIGELAALTANIHARQKGRRSYRPEEFMPYLEKALRSARRAKSAAMTAEAQFKYICMLNQVYGGDFIDNRPKKRDDVDD